MAANTVFDTGSESLPQRLPVWTNVTSKLLVPLEIRSRSETVDGRITELSRGIVSAGRFAASAHFGVRTPQAIQLDAGEGLLKLALAIRGRVMVSQGQRTVGLAPGEAALYRVDEPYIVGSDAPFDVIVAVLPQQMLKQGPPVDECTLRRFSPRAANAVTAMLRDGSLRTAPTRFGLAVRAMAARAAPRAEGESSLAWVFEQASVIIDAHDAPSDLTPQYLAEVLGVSRRTLYSAFQAHGLTVAAVIRDARLRCARTAILANPSLRLSDLSSELGFAHPGHLTRAYKRRYGYPPSREVAG